MDICITCGTNRENPQTGYCINGHDDWLQLYDLESGSSYWVRRAAKKFKMTIEELETALREDKDLSHLT